MTVDREDTIQGGGRKWIDPYGDKIRLPDYASRWIAEGAGPRPRTVQLYSWTLGKDITRTSRYAAQPARYADDPGVADPDTRKATVGLVWRGTFHNLVKWSATVTAIGARGPHFYDLRHTGNTLASRVPGVSLRNVMARMGTTAHGPR